MKSKMSIEDRLALAISAFIIVMLIAIVAEEDAISLFGGSLVAYWGYRFVINNISFSVFCTKQKTKKCKKKEKDKR